MVLYKTKVPYQDIGIPDVANPKSEDAFNKIINAARGLWCKAYSLAPGLASSGPVGDLNRGVYESVCAPADDPLPDPPVPPYTGGQCEGVIYDVFGVYTSYNDNPSFGCGTLGCRTFGPGPIGATVQRPGDPTWYLEVQGNTVQWKSDGSLGEPTNSGIRVDSGPCRSGSSGLGLGGAPTITSVSRRDGQPDNCGDPDKEYPQVDPPDPPISDTVDVAPPGRPSINIPLVYVPVDVNFNIQPYIDVGGVQITFQIDGVELSYDPDLPLPPGSHTANNIPETLLPKAPLPSDTEFPTVENCCAEVNQILNKVNTDLPAPDYTARFDALDEADVVQNNKLDTLLLDPIIEIVVPIGQCLIDSNGLPFYVENDTTISTLESDADRTQNAVLFNNLKIRDECRPSDPNNVCVAAIPENWQQMLGAARPRLVQVMRRAATRTYHQYSIPHPANPAFTDEPFLPNFQGGNWLGIIRCNDGARFMVYCRTKGIAQTVVNAALALIDPLFLDDPPHIRFTELPNSNVSTDERIATKNVYYEDGSLSAAPTWEVKIPGSDI